jgi:Ca2+-binding RTX toxin-like protein
MELKFSIFDSGTLVAGGTAFFNAADNSGNKTFSWEFDVDSLTLEKDVNYTVELYSEVGQNAIIHNPALFGMPLVDAKGNNANIHPQPDIDNDGNLVEPWEDSVSFSFLTEEPSVTFDVSGDSNLLIGDANSGKDVIYDTPQDDTVIGLDGDDELYASEGNDTLIGGADDDILVGGSGNDILFGGEGDDDLTGGEGADTFVWNQGDIGNDSVVDFSLAESDRLNIADLLSDENVTADTVHEYVHAGTSGNDLVLTIDPAGDVQSGGDYQITLVGAADLESQSLVDLLNQLQGTEVL